MIKVKTTKVLDTEEYIIDSWCVVPKSEKTMEGQSTSDPKIFYFNNETINVLDRFFYNYNKYSFTIETDVSGKKIYNFVM